MKLSVFGIAHICHEANRAYCKYIGDSSQPEWADAPEWQRDSAVNGVLYHIKNIDATPEDSHIVWLKQKLEEGWTYGPVKDPEKREHPCCVEYSELPVEQQIKDYIFCGIVKSLAKFVFTTEKG